MNIEKKKTPICRLDDIDSNTLFVKRDDLIPFSFGGNKARKAILFFKEIDAGDYDCVVTYGSSSSNHCRVVANLCAVRKIDCYIISPHEASQETYNSKLMKFFNANITVCNVSMVRDTIENIINRLYKSGKKPYFIAGGGHGNIGTQAYIDCYDEIRAYEKENNIYFDYIFHASGTGTTQAGLVCGQLINRDDRKIIGISIARKNPYGRDVVLQSIRDYFEEQNVTASDEIIENATIFVDDYTDGYGKSNCEIEKVINNIMVYNGIPLDSTYTGKAFFGMCEEIKKQNISDKNILFIHTGGTPLFFDYLK